MNFYCRHTGNVLSLLLPTDYYGTACKQTDFIQSTMSLLSVHSVPCYIYATFTHYLIKTTTAIDTVG